jgi:hypothetical protein
MSQQTSQLITATEAARLRNVHPKTFARWKIAPAIPGRRGRGGGALFDPAIVEAFQPPDTGRPIGFYVPPEPAPPKAVDCPLPSGIERQIQAGLELGAKKHRSPKWLDTVTDKWLAEASKVDRASVKASGERNPSIRERDVAEKDGGPRVNQDGEPLGPRPHVKTSTSDEWRPREDAKLTDEEKAARRRHLADLVVVEGQHSYQKSRDVRHRRYDSHDSSS